MKSRSSDEKSPAPVYAPKPESSPEESSSQAPGEAPSPDPAKPPDASAKLAAAEKEIARLTARVAELETQAPKGKTREDRVAQAKEIMELLRKGKDNPDSFKRLLQLITDLDPAMGPYFLERILDPEEKADKEALYDLALASGGPEVAEWYVKMLDDPALTADTRRRLLRIVGGGSKEIFSIRNLPVTGRLGEMAFQFANSSVTQEKQAAAGLLGAVDTPESRAALGRLAADSEWSVREVAIRSLGLAGDRDTLAWLDSMQSSLASTSEWERKRLGAAIDYAREQLTKKFPK
jgi:hypothetical protein